MNKQKELENTLKLWRTTPFKWGTDDCLISLADYLIRLGFDDFGIPFRNKYNDEQSALLLIQEHGGETAIINSTGFEQTNDPENGDLVQFTVFDKSCAGLFNGGMGCFRSENCVLDIDVNLMRYARFWKVA